jgi:hypothetical protein
MKLAVWPFTTTAEEDPLTVRLKSSVAPESSTVSACARSAALTITIPVREPAGAGAVNVTPIWQADPTPSVAGQLLLPLAQFAVTAAVKFAQRRIGNAPPELPV